jgi:hypothetical protein
MDADGVAVGHASSPQKGLAGIRVGEKILTREYTRSPPLYNPKEAKFARRHPAGSGREYTIRAYFGNWEGVLLSVAYGRA